MVDVGDVRIGGGHPPVIIAGPCVLEGDGVYLEIAEAMKDLCNRLGLQYIFKASWDKANRTSGASFRGVSITQAGDCFQKVRAKGIPVTTDVHNEGHPRGFWNCVDLFQIPSLLCRQTDLIQEAALLRPVSIKKGQFMSPDQMRYAVDKANAKAAFPNAFVIERGTTFGYNDLVVDFRSIPIMKQFAPVVFDATHSIQKPGGRGSVSGGVWEMAPTLAYAACAVGVHGLFLETHPTPTAAKSDGPCMVPLREMRRVLERCAQIWKV